MRLSSLIYYLGVAFLLAHEMDAVKHAEWELLYVLRTMDAATAYHWFVALHVPLFFLILWLSHHPVTGIRQVFRSAAASFLVLHGVIHAYNMNSPLHHFSGALAHGLIYGAAICGAIYLLLVILLRGRSSKTSGLMTDK